VKLTWDGIIELNKERMGRLLVVAHGSEKLKWRSKLPGLKGRADVTILPGGHAIDFSGGVRYGIIGEPVPDSEAAAKDSPIPPDSPNQFPDAARKQLVQVLGGGRFVVFRDIVQDELKLSDEQKKKLLEKFPDYVMGTMKVFEKIKHLKPPEREKEMQEHRRKSEEKLSTLLKDVLEAKQQERLFQLQLQQAGVFALLGQNEAFLPLKITEEQRKQFMELVQEMEKKIQSLIKEVENGSKPEEVLPKVMKTRKEHEGKIEAILSESQRKQWKELLGQPLRLDD